MNVKLEKPEKNVVQFEIEIEPEKVEEAMQKAFIRNAKKFSIPGFRKGKAPRGMVERFYGESVLYEDTINILYPEAFDKAVSENNVKPVERPELDIKQIGKGKSLIFTAKVTIVPEVVLGEYKGLKIETVKNVVSDDDIEKTLKNEAERNSRLVAVEGRPVEKGDTVIMNYEGSIDGVTFEGGAAENFSLEIGSGRFIPGFEDQIAGMAAGEEKEINVTFPEEYGKPELAGKPAVFKTKVNEIKKKEIPAIDDDFAKDVSEFETLAEYKESIRKKLTDEAGARDKKAAEDELVEIISKSAVIDIPGVMIDSAAESSMEDFSNRLSYQGLDINKYLEIIKKDKEELKAEMRVSAEAGVRKRLVLNAVAEAEKIEASEDDVEAEILSYAKNYGVDKKPDELEEFKKKIREEELDFIKDSIVLKKTVEFIYANAVIKEKADGEDVAAKADDADIADLTDAAETADVADVAGAAGNANDTVDTDDKIKSRKKVT
ncbi:MAG: trigger factor [Eubacteriales bacterium]|nr:trigger factor [Eubacteriales bacterium]